MHQPGTGRVYFTARNLQECKTPCNLALCAFMFVKWNPGQTSPLLNCSTEGAEFGGVEICTSENKGNPTLLPTVPFLTKGRQMQTLALQNTSLDQFSHYLSTFSYLTC